MERRIAPPGSPGLQSTLERLVTPEVGRSESIFRSKQKALMFAAALGWHNTARVPLDRRGEPIRFAIFEGALDDGFVNALAVAETKDLSILSPDREDERATIFEEYAHGGLLALQNAISAPGDTLEQILRIIMETRAAGTSEAGVAPDLARLFRL